MEVPESIWEKNKMHQQQWPDARNNQSMKEKKGPADRLWEQWRREKKENGEEKELCAFHAPESLYNHYDFLRKFNHAKKKKKSFKKFKTPQNQRITNTTLIIIIIIFLSSPQSIMFNLTFIHLLSLWSRSLHAVWILGVQCNCRDWAIDPKIT